MFSERVQNRNEQRGATRKRVIDTAERLFATEGFRVTTIRRIAGAADVSVGTVMGVGDKDELLLKCFDRWIGAVHEERAAMPDAPVDDPVRAAGEVVQPFLNLFASRPELSREYGAVLARGTHSTAVFGELAVALTSEFEYVARAAGCGEASAGAARVLYYGYLGLLRATSVGGDSPLSVRDGLEDIAATLFRRTSEMREQS